MGRVLILPFTRRLPRRLSLCLFDADNRQVHCYRLPDHIDGVWNGYLPGCEPGQRYGYRVHGPWSPSEGIEIQPVQASYRPLYQGT